MITAKRGVVTIDLPRPAIEALPNDLGGISQLSRRITGEIEIAHEFDVRISQQIGQIGDRLAILTIQGIVQILRPDGKAHKLFVYIVIRTIHMELN